MRSQAAPLFVSCLAKERARREPVQSRKAIVIARREAGGFRPGLWVFHQGGNGRLPIKCRIAFRGGPVPRLRKTLVRSEEHTSELQSLMRISYAVFCLKKKKKKKNTININRLHANTTNSRDEI